METTVLQTDIAIIGGGVAGLWLLNQLRARGYSAVLFEHDALGSQQTIASQGMIHGGIKYALGGSLSGAARAIAAMPGRWRAALAGQGPVDLRGCEILSEYVHLWSSARPSSRLSAFLASKFLRGHVQPLSRGEFPPALNDDAFTGQVYRLDDLVLDIPSLLRTLARPQNEAIVSIDWCDSSLHAAGGSAQLSLPGCRVLAQQFVLTAGAGNAALLAGLGAATPSMQRRPLQQVLVRHDYPGRLFGHCLGHSATPRLTVSTHRMRDGRPVWYLGGDLASDPDTPPDSLIDAARRELQELLPWIDLGDSEWRTLRMDRAEAAQIGRARPDCAFVDRVTAVDNAIVAWPTKLTLCPDLADGVEALLAARDIRPRLRTDLNHLAHLGKPGFAPACWDTLFQ